MKKYLIIFIVFVYGVFSLGLNVQVHYCGGNFSGINLFQFSEKKCDDNSASTCCGADHCCCSFQNIYLSLDENHSPSFRQVVFHACEFALRNEVFECIQYACIAIEDECPRDNEVPPDIPLFLKYHSLTYYG